MLNNKDNYSIYFLLLIQLITLIFNEILIMLNQVNAAMELAYNFQIGFQDNGIGGWGWG